MNFSRINRSTLITLVAILAIGMLFVGCSKNAEVETDATEQEAAPAVEEIPAEPVVAEPEIPAEPAIDYANLAPADFGIEDVFFALDQYDLDREAMSILTEGAGTAFDPEVVSSFLQVMGEYPPGSMFRIGSGEVVMVTGGGKGAPSTGLIVRDPEGRKLADPQPVEFGSNDVMAAVLAEDAGIEPAELLEAVDA
jgi:hypothetical protein